MLGWPSLGAGSMLATTVPSSFCGEAGWGDSLKSGGSGAQCMATMQVGVQPVWRACSTHLNVPHRELPESRQALAGAAVAGAGLAVLRRKGSECSGAPEWSSHAFVHRVMHEAFTCTWACPPRAEQSAHQGHAVVQRPGPGLALAVGLEGACGPRGRDAGVPCKAGCVQHGSLLLVVQQEGGAEAADFLQRHACRLRFGGPQRMAWSGCRGRQPCEVEGSSQSHLPSTHPPHSATAGRPQSQSGWAARHGAPCEWRFRARSCTPAARTRAGCTPRR